MRRNINNRKLKDQTGKFLGKRLVFDGVVGLREISSEVRNFSTNFCTFWQFRYSLKSLPFLNFNDQYIEHLLVIIAQQSISPIN